MSRMKLYFFDDGMVKDREGPRFEFSANTPEELMQRFDDAMAELAPELCYMLEGFDCRERGSQDFDIIDGVDETYYGQVYIVDDEPAVKMEK